MILGAVLAGGRSFRFGSDKAAALWRAAPLIEHVVRRLASISDAVVICGRRDSRHKWIDDRPAPGLGPLGGLNAALHHAVRHGYTRVISTPCDTPVLDEALLRALVQADGNACLASLPIIGCWQVALAHQLDEHLRAGRDRAMRGWAEAIGAAELALTPPPNINRIADLTALETRYPAKERSA